MTSFLIVGAKFRPPARGLLDILPVGTRLLARREASNAHDPNAVQVLVQSADFSSMDHELLDKALDGYGHSARSVLAQPEWHLGYIPRERAAELAPLMDAEGTAELPGQLTFNAAGLALIALEEPHK